MQWKKAPCLAGIVVLLLIACGIASSQGSGATDKAAWVEKLSKIKESPTTGLDYQTLYSILQTDPETMYSVLQESWARIASEKARSYLIQLIINNNGVGIRVANGGIEEIGQINPHLLDILHLGATDSSPNVQKTAFQALYSISYQDFTDLDSYKSWRQKTEGKSAPEIVRENSRLLVEKLAKADNQERIKIFVQMMRMPYYTYVFANSNTSGARQEFIGIGLAGIRRKAMLEADIMSVAADSLHTDKPKDLKEKTILFLARFHPKLEQMGAMEEDIRRELPVLLAKQTIPDYELVQFAGTFKARWAGDLLLKLLAKEELAQQSYIVIDALATNGDPRAIPSLIAMYDTVDPAGYQGQNLERALARITMTPYSQNHDGDWWRAWWRQNRARYPEEVRNLPFPKIGESRTINGYLSLRRRKSRHDIADDPHRVYWLISPGILAPPGEGALPTVAGSKSGPGDIPKSARPGLIVVLEEGDVHSEARKEFWMQAAIQAFQSRYLIALVAPPKWKPNQTIPWVTQANHALVPEAAFTTESFVREVVRDVEANYPINPDRIYLHGEGEAGLAAYACALDKQAPFQGAWILASPFRSAGLPLAQAKGRRFYIQHSKEDKSSPFYLAAAAQELLQKQGATVKLATYAGGHGYPLEGDKWEPLQSALAWLESDKLAANGRK